MSFLSLANPTSNRLGAVGHAAQGIADFENELKTYQGGLKKEAYYFYKRYWDSRFDMTGQIIATKPWLVTPNGGDCKGRVPQNASKIQVLRIVLIIPRESTILYLQQSTIVDLHHSNLPSHHFDHPNLGGLELAQKRLQDVTTDLDNFDKRMDDLLHIATNFNYPEDGRNNKKHASNKGWMVDRKCSDIMMRQRDQSYRVLVMFLFCSDEISTCDGELHQSSGCFI